MKRGRLALFLPLLWASTARGDTPPSPWDIAKDPAVGERYQLHRQVSELMTPPEGTPARMRNALYLRARGLLEEASAATSPDMRLRFDLGEVYYRLDHYEQAIEVLEPALKLAPAVSGSIDAWEALAFAAAKLDRSAQELDAYDHYLALVPGYSSLSILGNRAEAEMRLGDLDAAVAGYRDVIEHAEHMYGPDYRILVLARWGLAVALDRNHYQAESEHEAQLVSEMDAEERIIGDKDEVFFVPEYERDWYYALGRTQRAKHEPDARKALGLWRLVVATWADYVDKATPDDRWVGLARKHLAAAEAEQRVAAARFAEGQPKLRELLSPKRHR